MDDDIEESERHTKDHPQASSICAIDKKSVHRICSGQVVLTLGTAVKELLENSIDAGATIIEIKLKEYGSELIEVSDNGIGVHPSNFEGLTLKHHTSKLRDFGDLINVDTFGFRGEALSSLCALCTMSVTTRHKDESVGTKLEFDHNGKITKQEAQARQVGTKVVLQNLFYTLPVRHKEFQRNLKKEFAKMVQVLNSYCIISTGVRITCTNTTNKGSRSTVVSSQGNPSLQENISNVFGPKQLQSLLEFKQKVPGEDVCTEYGLKADTPSLFKIQGFVSKCEHGQGRSSTDRQFLFINGRPFDSTKLTKVINEVYHQYNRHQYPFVVLKITVNKEGVDVNVTPDKRQVFMEGEKILLATVKSSLGAMFESTTSILQLQQPDIASKLVRSKSEPEQYDSRLTSDSSLTKSTNMATTLSKLKRSFSSAFAKQDDSFKSHLSPSKSSPMTKQRRLDSFVQRDITTEVEEPTVYPGHSIRQLDGTTTSNTDPDTVKASAKELDHSESHGVHRTYRSAHHIHLDDIEDGTKTDPILIDESGDHLFNSTEKSITFNGVIQDEKVTIDDYESSRKAVYQISKHSLTCQGDQESDNVWTTGVKESGTTTTDIGNIKANYTSNDRCNESRSDEHRSAVKIIDFKSSLSENSVNMNCDTQFEEVRRHEATVENKHDNFVVISHGDIVDAQNMKVEDFNHHVDEVEDIVKSETKVSFNLKQFQQNWKNRSKVTSKDTYSRAFRAKINPTDNQAAEQELQREIKKESFSKMEILGQFNMGFIITKLEEDLFIVDQHATDEKYNFETLQRDTIIQSQKLINPMNLELTASNETILVDNIEIFRKNGFEFLVDESGPPTQRVKLTSTPVSKNWNFGKEDIEEMIFMLTDSPGVMCRPSRVRAMFASRACRKSIMIGTVLNKAEMKKLLGHMGEIEQPWNCPHGRPTMRHLINLDMIPK